MNQGQQLAGTFLRVVLGIVFLVHGIMKLQMGLENVAGWFGSMGIPAFIAYLTAYIELLGGIAMIVGIGTRYVAIALAVIMVGAIVTVKLAAGFAGNGQGAGYEFDLVLLAVSVYFAAAPGVGYSLDNLFFNKTSEQK